MHVRIARFEGADTSRVDQDAADIRRSMRADAPPEGMPAEAFTTLRENVLRVMLLADRSAGTTVDLVFTRDEASMREVDAALSSLTPPEGVGRRTSVDLYEVVLDETTG